MRRTSSGEHKRVEGERREAVIVVCSSTGTLQTGTASDKFCTFFKRKNIVVVFFLD